AGPGLVHPAVHVVPVGPLRGHPAGAVLSIAYNRAVPAVDGNVMRVFSRLFLIEDDIMQPATRQGMEALAKALIPAGQAGNFNQALMELGALICAPTSPKCLACPVAEHCRALAEGRQEELPVKAKAKAPRPVDVVAGVIWHEQRVLLVRRPAEGLLGGLWAFPGGEKPAGLSWEQALHLQMREGYGLELEVEAHLADVKHVFTHLVWDLKAYTARLAPNSSVPAESDALRWITPAEISRYPLPVAHQKVAVALLACLPGKPQDRISRYSGLGG
ncbi:MAG TPA: NUDIX domain-containing protein, partial [Symbiobacteriaceae bacterium]|nr:NUDIX domain-containing protein [Symbiobacteriaceae bacterium]